MRPKRLTPMLCGVGAFPIPPRFFPHFVYLSPRGRLGSLCGGPCGRRQLSGASTALKVDFTRADLGRRSKISGPTGRQKLELQDVMARNTFYDVDVEVAIVLNGDRK